MFEAIKERLTAEEVIARVTDPEWDDELDRRQYAVVTMHDNARRPRAHRGLHNTGAAGDDHRDDGSVRYAGVMADPSRGVSAQGNTLVSAAVVQGPLNAYRRDDPAGSPIA